MKELGAKDFLFIAGWMVTLITIIILLMRLPEGWGKLLAGMVVAVAAGALATVFHREGLSIWTSATLAIVVVTTLAFLLSLINR